jgi:hypothetical protein
MQDFCWQKKKKTLNQISECGVIKSDLVCSDTDYILPTVTIKIEKAIA